MRRLALVALTLATLLSGQRSGKLVTLNVSAVEASGARPGDLTESDFQVFEDGKPQKIVSFVKNDGRAHAEERLGPHEFSNRSGAAIPHATLILFDLLNDRMAAKGYAWNEIVKTLEHLETTDFLYMYVLGNDGTFFPVHPLPDPEAANRPDDGSWTRNIKVQLDAAMAKATRIRPIDMTDVNLRVITTFNSLGAIASRLAAIPGRKNLVWITRGIPVSIGPQRSDTGDFIDYSGPIQRFAAAMERSEIAIYPVDIAPAGMEPTSDASNGNGAVAPGAGMGRADTLQQFADLTGGQAFLNNAVKDAITMATADGRMSYLISYYAPKVTSDGKYHKIKLTCSRKGVKVHSKAGYYSWANSGVSRTQQEAALGAAIDSQFDASQIGIRAVLSPSPKFYSSIQLKLAIDRTGLNDSQQGQLFVTLADIHKDGKRGVSPAVTVDYTAADGPIPLTQDRTVDGTIESVRVIVTDARSNAIGSLTIPIAATDLSPAGPAK